MEKKKVLTLLLGSPRKDGNTEKLADALAEGASKKGYEVRKVRLASMNLKGCIDCRKCWSTGKPCIQNDDMNDNVYPDIEAADVLVFASPLYFYSWSTQIKPVWDRLIPFYAKEAPRTLKGKKSILLAAAGDTEESKLEGITVSYKNCLEYLGWESLGEITAPGIYSKGDIEKLGEKYLKQAEELGASL